MARRSNWLVRWMRLNIFQPLLAVLQTGAEPETLAMSGALGITVGIFPIYGVTALMCACAVAILGKRCNPPTMLLANLIATPLEFSLVVPFMRLGEFIVGGEHFPLSKDSLWKFVTGKASWDVVLGLCHALLGWIIAAPLIVGGLYFILLPVMRFAIHKYGHGSERADGEEESLMKDTTV